MRLPRLGNVGKKMVFFSKRTRVQSADKHRRHSTQCIPLLNTAKRTGVLSINMRAKLKEQGLATTDHGYKTGQLTKKNCQNSTQLCSFRRNPGIKQHDWSDPKQSHFGVSAGLLGSLDIRSVCDWGFLDPNYRSQSAMKAMPMKSKGKGRSSKRKAPVDDIDEDEEEYD